jgi:hypothetical protein
METKKLGIRPAYMAKSIWLMGTQDPRGGHGGSESRWWKWNSGDLAVECTHSLETRQYYIQHTHTVRLEESVTLTLTHTHTQYTGMGIT